MMPTTSARLLRLLNRAYEAMLLAYPSKFRREYSREMALAFRDRARDVVGTRGSWALVPFTVNITGDWLKTVTRERLDMDTTQRLNRVSSIVLTVLSLTALAPLLIVALPAMATGHVPPPEPDEGIAAHIFQLSIVALLPVGLMFLVTADWKQPLRSMRHLAFPAAAVVLAFGMLFYFERIYLPAHGHPLPRPGLPLLLLRRILTAFHRT